MKSSIIYIIILGLFFSCSTKNVEPIEEPVTPTVDVISLGLPVVIVDEEYNDRLNPASPSYFGDEFVQKMNVSYLIEGKRLTHLQAYYYGGGGSHFWRDDIEQFNPIYQPVISNVVVCPENVGNCFIVDCMSEWGIFKEEGKKVSYTYIQYPDGSEDELKLEIWENESGSVMTQGKIWVNGELAFSRMSIQFETSIGTFTNHYFNPEYYPFMKPLLNDDGIKIGEVSAIMLVITK